MYYMTTQCMPFGVKTRNLSQPQQEILRTAKGRAGRFVYRVHVVLIFFLSISNDSHTRMAQLEK